MTKNLWTVLADLKPVAVVAADRNEEAWRIVTALADHGDLPGDRRNTDIVPCLPALAAKTLSAANRLGCADTFLACVREMMFLTAIGGMVPEPTIAERVA